MSQIKRNMIAQLLDWVLPSLFVIAIVSHCPAHADEDSGAYRSLVHLLGGGNGIPPTEGIIGFSQTYPPGFSPSKENSNLWPVFWRVSLPPMDTSDLPKAEEAIWTTIASLKRLFSVSAIGRGIDDRHLAALMGHQQLRCLNIAGTRVSSGQIQSLVRKTPHLRWLVLSDGMLTDTEEVDLRRRFPDLLLHVVLPKEIPVIRRAQAAISRDTPVPDWLRDDLVSRGEYRQEDLRELVRIYSTNMALPLIDAKSLQQALLAPDLFVCDFVSTSAGDEHMEALAGLGKVVYLGVADTRVSGRGLKVLKRMRSLRVVHLDEELLTDETIEYLRNITCLRWLTVDCNRLPFPREVELNRALPRTELRFRIKIPRDVRRDAQFAWDGPSWALELGGNGLKGASGGHFLQAFHSLAHLFINPGNRDKIDLNSISVANTLKELRLELVAPVDDPTLESIAKLESLENLQIGSEVNVHSFQPLSKLKNIRIMSVWCESLTEQRIVELCDSLHGLRGLRRLFLGHAIISDDVVRSLEKCLSLREFSHGYETKLKVGEGVIFDRLRQLEHFHGNNDFQRAVKKDDPPN